MLGSMANKIKKTASSEKPQAPIIAKDYIETLELLKKRIREARLKAAISVNSELVKLYWEIGCTLSQKMQIEGWGAKTIDRIAKI